MASTPASIDVSFNANYTGSHRVCWRIGSSGPYDCSTTVVCAGGGNPCSTSVGITVDDETCNDVTFEGYVQATCEDIGSLNGRVPFSITFTPNPTCKPYRITCSSVSVGGGTVTVPGSGYTPPPAAAPTVTLTGGGGSGATATALVGKGGIKTTTVTNGGTGYDGGGSAIFNVVPANTLTGVGSGATFNVHVGAGIVTSVDVVAPGVDYAISDTFNFDNTHLGGTGSGVVITVASVNTGTIESITITAAGSGYSSVPTLTIAPSPSGPSGNATGIATLNDCGLLDYGTDCDGSNKPDITAMSLNETFVTCYQGVPPTLGTGYTIAADNDACCYDCIQYTITKPSSGTAHPATVVYTDCTTRDSIQQTINNSGSIVACAVNGSLLIHEQTTGGTTNVAEGVCP